MIKNEEFEYICNLLYFEFKHILELSDDEWIYLFKKFESIINE